MKFNNAWQKSSFPIAERIQDLRANPHLEPEEIGEALKLLCEQWQVLAPTDWDGTVEIEQRWEGENPILWIPEIAKKSAPKVATVAKVKAVRTKTGASIMQCKYALEEVGGDVGEAIRKLQFPGSHQT